MIIKIRFRAFILKNSVIFILMIFLLNVVLIMF